MFAAVIAQCVPESSNDLLSNALINSDYTITFDDTNVGFPSSWGWNDSGYPPLLVSYGQQNITISGATCRITSGVSGFYSTSWRSDVPWMGETAPNIQYFGIIGGVTGSGRCLFKFNPPITAYTVRLVATPIERISYMQVFGVNGTEIGCKSSLPEAPGINNYTIVGAHSRNLIGSFSLDVGSTAAVQFDNIQLLTCREGQVFNGTACVGKRILKFRNWIIIIELIIV